MYQNTRVNTKDQTKRPIKTTMAKPLLLSGGTRGQNLVQVTTIEDAAFLVIWIFLHERDISVLLIRLKFKFAFQHTSSRG